MTLRTDLNVVPLPSPLPNWGGLVGANKIQIDPNFGSKIVRLTDATLNKNGTIQTADDAEDGIWNTNDTLIAVKNTGGGRIIFNFNPTTMQGSRTNLPNYGASRFSGVSPNVYYEILKTKITQYTFTLTGTKWSAKGVTLCDFANILPSGYKVTWTGTFGLAHDDSTVVVAFSNKGAQGTGSNICVYRVGAGYRMLDTQSSLISGQWGAVGKAVLNSANYKFPFTLHEANACPNPTYATLGPAATPGVPDIDDTLLWTIDSLNINEVMTDGHAARGMQHIYPGGVGGGGLACFNYTNVTKTGKSLVIPTQNLPAGYTGDRHFGFGKFDPNDQSIIWATSLNTKGITAAWENEVFGYDVVKGVVYRACHTFGSGKSTFFDTLNTMGCASQSGNFVAFSSDIMQSLGTTSGKESSKATSTDIFRGDVFVVQVGD